MSRLSRRGILGGAAALVPAAAVGVGVSPSPAQPDAALIATVERFKEANRVMCAVCSAEPDYGDPRKPEWEAQEAATTDACSDLADEVVALPCTTLAGVLALADAVVAYTPEVLNPSSYTNEELLRRLMEEVLALRGAA